MVLNYTNYILNNIESSIFEDRISEFANLNSSAISDLFWDSYPNHHSSEVKFIQHDPSEPRCAMIGNTFFFLPYCMIFTGYLIKLIACYHPWVRSGWRQSLVHIGTQCLTGLQLIWNNQPYTLWVWLLHDSMTICSYHARHLLTYWPITKCFDYPTAVWQLESSISSGWGDTETCQQVIGNDIWAIIPFP